MRHQFSNRNNLATIDHSTSHHVKKVQKSAYVKIAEDHETMVKHQKMKRARNEIVNSKAEIGTGGKSLQTLS